MSKSMFFRVYGIIIKDYPVTEKGLIKAVEHFICAQVDELHPEPHSVFLRVMEDGQKILTCKIVEVEDGKVTFENNYREFKEIDDFREEYEMQMDIRNSMIATNKGKHNLALLTNILNGDEGFAKIMKDLMAKEPKSMCTKSKSTKYGDVDYSLHKLITILNDNDYLTLGSCSGLSKEHNFSDDQDHKGYIAFLIGGLSYTLALIQELIKLGYEVDISHVNYVSAAMVSFSGEEELNKLQADLLKNIRQYEDLADQYMYRDFVCARRKDKKFFKGFHNMLG